MLQSFYDNYLVYELILAQLQLVFFMFGMGAALTGHDFLAIARQPRSLLAGGAVQFLLTPVIAVLVNLAFGLDALPGIAVGIVLMSLMPGGTLSKAFALLGRGNLALSISLSICGTFATLVTVPTLLPLLAGGYIPEFEMPTLAIIRDICLFMLLPVVVGLLFGRSFQRHRLTVARWSVRAGFVVVILVLVGSLGSGRIDPYAYGWRGPLAIIVFCVLSQQLGMLMFRLRGWPREDTLSVGIEATMRNINLAVLLYVTIFAGASGELERVGNGVLFVALYYAGVAFFAGLPLALRFRLKARREEKRRAALVVQQET